MNEFFLNKDASLIILNMIEAISDNKQYLSDIDGLIGDGDHGINMNKGFQLCKQQLGDEPKDLTHSSSVLSKILLMKIGGSMGPLYGKLYSGMSKAVDGVEEIGIIQMQVVLNNMLSFIQKISPAVVGDKTLIDCLAPAVDAYNKSVENNTTFVEALENMKAAAIVGRDSTKDMVAKLGRASRLGDRSKGVLDAGASSCCLLLESLVETSKLLLKGTSKN